MEAVDFVILFLYMFPFGKRYKCDLVNHLYIYSVLLQADKHFKFKLGEYGPTSIKIHAAIRQVIEDGVLLCVPSKKQVDCGLDGIGLIHDFDLSLESLYGASNKAGVDNSGIEIMRNSALKMFFLVDYISSDIIVAALALSRHISTCPGYPIAVSPRVVMDIGFPFTEVNHKHACEILIRLGLMSRDDVEK